MRTNQTIKNRYTITAGVLKYSVTFPLYEATDVGVYLSKDGGNTDSKLTLNTDYTVSINDGNTGGSVTLKSGVASAGNFLVLLSELPYTQELDLTGVSTIDVEANEIQLDRDCQQRQQLKEMVDRAVKVRATGDITPEELRDTLLLGKAETEQLLTSQTAIDRLYTSVNNIDRVYQSIDNVDTDAAHIAYIDTDAQHIANIDTVAGHIGNVDTVSTNIAGVNTVANNIESVKTVDDNIADVNTVAANIGSVNTVALIKDDVVNAYTNAESAKRSAEVAGQHTRYFATNVAELKAGNFQVGMCVQTLGYYTANDGGTGTYIIRAKKESDVDDGGSVHFLSNGLVAELIVENCVNVKQYGAKGDGTNNDTDAIQSMINANYSYKTITFPSGNYCISSAITFPNETKCIHVVGTGITKIICLHNGDCIVLQNNDSEMGQCVFENLILEGTNPHYSSLSELTNIGAGIKLLSTYENKFINCLVIGFKYGLYLHIGIGNDFESGCYFRYNEYGAYIYGGASNLNRFTNCNFRENRRSGIYIKHDESDNNYILSNTFTNCYIESNVPYIVDERTEDNESYGVYLQGSMTSVFYGCYFEYNMLSIMIDESTEQNIFRDCVFSNNPGWKIIRFKGNVTRCNRFVDCVQGSNVTLESVDISESTDSSIFTNEFRNCYGFIFNSILNEKNKPTIKNSNTNGVNAGVHYSKSLTGEKYQNIGSFNNKDNPYIEGIGTTNAILHTMGYGHIQIGSLLTSDTTIVKIDGMEPGQILYVDNFQNSHKITFANGTSHTDKNYLTMQNGNIVLSDYGDNISFICSITGINCELSHKVNSETRDVVGERTSFVSSGGATAKIRGNIVSITGDISLSSSASGWEDVVGFSLSFGSAGTFFTAYDQYNDKICAGQVYDNNGSLYVRFYKPESGQYKFSATFMLSI